jgi:hypothetical protein
MQWCRNKYTRWVDGGLGMPIIPKNLKDCAFYLYLSRQDTRFGENVGGTGFIIVSPIKLPGHDHYKYIYAVSNWHVVKGDDTTEHPPYQIMNINKVNTEIEFFDVFSPDDWIYFSEDCQDDIMTSPHVTLNQFFHLFLYISSSFFLKYDNAYINNIGVGNNLFIIVRFIKYDNCCMHLTFSIIIIISIMSNTMKHYGESTCNSYHIGVIFGSEVGLRLFKRGFLDNLLVCER